MAVQATAAEIELTFTPQRQHARFRSKKLVAGTVILGVFVVVAVIGPWVITTNPSSVSTDVLAPPSTAHWLGTTQTGQDVLAQLVDSTRVSMLVGFVAAAIATALSVVVGVVGGYAGGLADELLSVLSNVFLVIPALPLVIVLAGYLPNKGWMSVAVVIALTGWAWGARLIRVQTLSIRKRDYVEAARASGDSTIRILFFEILPNEGAIIAATFLGTVVFAILTQAGLAFLGLSDISSWSWGTMLYWAQNAAAINSGAWWWYVPPGLCIGLVGTSLALMNFGIDELVNPKLAGTRVARSARHRGERERAGGEQ